MKYIRTKDGVYKVCELSFGQIIPVDSKDNAIENVEIIKQADTIEELIDEYVRVHKTMNNRSMVCDKELAISSSKYPKHYDVYASIWVDGELHKVAKTNAKGELELL